MLHLYGLLTFNLDICAIEKIQRSAARYTMNNYSWRSSVTNMLTSPNWPSLESRRTFCKLVMFYKIINCQMEVPSISLTSMSSVTRSHSQRFKIPQARINSYLFSFLTSTIKIIMEHFPEDMVNQPSINCFKDILLNHLNLL